MKKFIKYLIINIIVLSLFGCSKNNDPSLEIYWTDLTYNGMPKKKFKIVHEFENFYGDETVKRTVVVNKTKRISIPKYYLWSGSSAKNLYVVLSENPYCFGRNPWDFRKEIDKVEIFIMDQWLLADVKRIDENTFWMKKNDKVLGYVVDYYDAKLGKIIYIVSKDNILERKELQEYCTTVYEAFEKTTEKDYCYAVDAPSIYRKDSYFFWYVVKSKVEERGLTTVQLTQN